MEKIIALETIPGQCSLILSGTLNRLRSMNTKLISKKLEAWYLSQARDLPWRETTNPYKIWVSETMLQQTTARAVIPFYQRFLKAFPNLTSLANATEPQVIENWAGLGYYSRARNLHKAAQTIQEMGSFPKTYEELIKLPGFGPYTSRAVASLAFGQSVGVVDGNSIRVISRLNNWNEIWWNVAGKNFVQENMDQLIAQGDPNTLNQAVMELGATTCIPQNPTCLICPIQRHCQGFRNQTQTRLPRKKEKKPPELWIWEPEIIRKGEKILIIQNQKFPFLKQQWILPGKGKRVEVKPKNYNYTHSITKYRIYVTPKKNSDRIKKKRYEEWVLEKDLKKWSPVSLVEKAILISKK